MKTFNVGLVGITGYAGMELARLLAGHPNMLLSLACSRAEAGRRLGEFYPFLERSPGSDVVISVFEPKEAAARCELVFPGRARGHGHGDGRASAGRRGQSRGPFG